LNDTQMVCDSKAAATHHQVGEGGKLSVKGSSVTCHARCMRMLRIRTARGCTAENCETLRAHGLRVCSRMLAACTSARGSCSVKLATKYLNTVQRSCPDEDPEATHN
jgi:hypothetical protein